MLEISTERLSLRPPRTTDLDDFARLGADDRVMEGLGGVATREASQRWLDGVLSHWRDHGVGGFVVTRAEAFVGMVGVSYTGFDPLIRGPRIGWRLAFDHWRKGYATEAACAVVDDAFRRLGLGELVSVTQRCNVRARAVMDRLGMEYSHAEAFDHPLVPAGSPWRTHVVYRLSRDDWCARGRTVHLQTRCGGTRSEGNTGVRLSPIIDLTRPASATPVSRK